MGKRGISRRGQFYLAAAIIITIIIFSLAMINNYARTEERETGVFDLKQEIGMESGSVVDFSLYNKSETFSLIENWTNLYVAGKRGQEIENWFFVYGTPGNITVLAFSNSDTGTISLDYGSGSVNFNMREIRGNKTVIWADYVNLSFGNTTYNFNMKSGKNFAFLINKGGYVANSEEI